MICKGDRVEVFEHGRPTMMVKGWPSRGLSGSIGFGTVTKVVAWEGNPRFVGAPNQCNYYVRLDKKWKRRYRVWMHLEHLRKLSLLEIIAEAAR